MFDTASASGQFQVALGGELLPSSANDSLPAPEDKRTSAIASGPDHLFT